MSILKNPNVLFGTFNVVFRTFSVLSEFSEYCEIKCFGGLHVYFRFEARKISSAVLLILLQLVIWPEIVSFCPNSTHFSLISWDLMQNPALLPPGWYASSELPQTCPPRLLILTTYIFKYTCNWPKHLSDNYFDIY